ncbi:MAG: hypothetical protein M1840_001737 [Geoglossum simile]|nr:MAG: hypothetical protein M1840_001737 [Geoglossum simile]
MAPQPQRHTPQSQPITTALRNICREYPAGGVVLRELLQNADDARATHVEFRLDTRSYPDLPLLHPGLRQYQGPALLAYNDAIFSEKDFESLARVGDSGKLEDMSSTGKFGFGFNSVYNWTDAPSILSQTTLLLLDPHHSWSASIGHPGGPQYCLSQDDWCLEIQNQLKPFSDITGASSQHGGISVEGTIIRLPLRTEEQGKDSKICQRAAKVEDIKEVLEKFITALGDGALVFLRSVESVTTWLDGEVIGKAEIANRGEVIRARETIDQAYADLFVSGHMDEFDYTFEMQTGLSLLGIHQRTSSFVVQHHMRRSVGGEGMARWAKKQKLFPWVAMAAPTERTLTSEFNGGLFTILPLNVPSNQPVNIHGLFSITSDRASLHSVVDSTTQDQNPSRWNKLLFDELIPVAWTKLLVYLSIQRPQTSAMELWPRDRLAVNQLGDRLLEAVLRIVGRERLRVWFTHHGHFEVEEGLYTEASWVSEQLRAALLGAKAPTIYLNEPLYSRVKLQFPNRRLNPKALCGFLRSSDSLNGTSSLMKQELLDYILCAENLGILNGIPLFRFEDGTYNPPDIISAFLHRNDFEKRMFKGAPQHNLDTEVLSRGVLEKLHRAMAKPHAASCQIRYRGPEDFRDYCHTTWFRECDRNQDIIPSSPGLNGFISEAWEWVRSQDVDISSDALESLWLIPLQGGHLRKITPKISAVPALHSLGGPTGELLNMLAAMGGRQCPPLLDCGVLSARTSKFLISRGDEDTRLFLGSCEELNNLLAWLVAGKGLLLKAGGGLKNTTLSVIEKQFRGELRVDDAKSCGLVADQLMQLSLFEKVRTVFEGEMRESREWVTLDAHESYIGFTELPFVPEMEGVSFIQCRDGRFREMFTALGIGLWPSIPVLVTDYIVPALLSGTCGAVSGDAKERSASLIFRNYLDLSVHCQSQVGKLPVVPAEVASPSDGVLYYPIIELLDPTAADLGSLLFADELVYPRRSLLDQFRGVMIQCGLRSKITWSFVMERIKCFSQTNRPLEEVAVRVKRLLQLPAAFDREPDALEVQELRDLKWIATIGDGASIARTDTETCRGFEYQLLVGRVLIILDYEVHITWRELFGWDSPLPVCLVMLQLERGVVDMDLDIVGTVLKYIEKSQERGAYVDSLAHMDCILSSSHTFLRPDRIFLTGSTGLRPYLDNVDTIFLNQHRSLLTSLGLHTEPSLDDLIGVQANLAAMEQPLNLQDTAVAVDVVRLASSSGREKLPGLKAPDQRGKLQGLSDLAFWDLDYSNRDSATMPLIHQDVPREAVERLGIQDYSEKLLMGEVGLDDQDDGDEFYQREKVTTGIADTLGRYPTTATFSEYLANAEDSGTAAQIDWLLDECLEGDHPSSTLLSKALAAFQGPALFVHNDGVFLDKDFEGLKDVGRGSKRDDPSTIGRSGRRKAGVKLELPDVRGPCPDQLAPFEGLWGYSRDIDEYKGTVFRFPLRQRGSVTSLTESTQVLDCHAAREHLEHYFHEARLSLLFLRRIKKITFQKRHAERIGWEVGSTLLRTGFLDSVGVSYRYTDQTGERVGGQDDWRLGMQNLDTVPEKLRGWQKRRLKHAECGIAALISPPSGGRGVVSGPRIFSTLPLRFPSNLPVHVHASFILTGDRQSVAVDDSSSHTGSQWNKWLLQHCIPALYLLFLEALVPVLERSVFNFWPCRKLAKDTLSDLIRTSFWDQVPSSHHRLYPLARSSKASRKSVKKEPPTAVEFREALFDFLPRTASDKLHHLLKGYFQNLVRIPLGKLHNDLKLAGDTIAILTPSIIRNRLQDSDACDELEKCVEDPTVLEALLRLIHPRNGEELEELDGCRILPLMDGSLGTLSTSPERSYFCVSDLEQQLFGFASEIMIRESVGKEFIDMALESPRLNVRKLGVEDLGRLLQLRPPAAWESTEGPGEWLRDFWQYFNKTWAHMPAADHTSIASLDAVGKFPIYQATRGKHLVYIKPFDFNRVPAVVEPHKAQQLELCRRFHGLTIVNRDTIPMNLRKTEDSLYRRDPLSRFLVSISAIAEAKGVGIEELITSELDTTNIQVLRKAIRAGLNEVKSAISGTSRIVRLIQQLPIWPTTIDNSTPNISAECALATGDVSLLVPWIHERKRFIEASFYNEWSPTLSYLSVDPITLFSMVEDHIVPSLPTSIQPENYDSYRLLVNAMADYDVRGRKKKKLPRITRHFQTERLAADGAGVLRRASELYDHEDNLYCSAFRNQETKRFLLPAVRGKRRFWVDLGLRGGATHHVDSTDYLEFLMSLNERIGQDDKTAGEHATLMGDIKVVLEGLNRVVDPSSTLRIRIKSIRFVPPSSQFGHMPTFRRPVMEDLSRKISFLRLSEVVLSKHLAYTWTQTPFPLFYPPELGLENLQLSGEPDISMVWDHLRAMVSVSSILQQNGVQAYLSDLSKTYQYLQDHEAEQITLTDLAPEQLWLNIDINESAQVLEINTSWIDAHHLVLFCPFDPGTVKSVRSFLMPFERLLRRCGCQTIRNPTWEMAEELPKSGSMMSEVTRLRKEQKLTDVTFSAEGKGVPAHKLVLAAASKYCEVQFTGAWSKSANNKAIILDDMSYSTLLSMIDFAYSDQIDWSGTQVEEGDSLEQIADKLDSLLDLLTGADRWGMPALLSATEYRVLLSARVFIRPDNVRDVEEIAAAANAKEVEAYCAKFCEDNCDIMEVLDEDLEDGTGSEE